jgi:hypothetical protein
MKLKKNKESSRHHRELRAKTREEGKRIGLMRSVPRFMRNKTEQECKRSKFKTEPELQSSQQ